MLDHLEIRTEKLDEAVRFYSVLLAPLGYEQKVDGKAKGFGDGVRLDFFLVSGPPSTDVHYAFEARSRAVVNLVYETGRKAGFALDRAPELAPQIHPDYYAGYLRDPDGRLIEFVCHQPE